MAESKNIKLTMQTTKEVEVKCCPFCGSTNVDVYETFVDLDDMITCVKCNDCQSEGGTIEDFLLSEENFSHFKDNRVESIVRWNHRGPGNNFKKHFIRVRSSRNSFATHGKECYMECCPFCGNNDVELVRCIQEGTETTAIQCKTCQAVGGIVRLPLGEEFRNTQIESVDKWNMRYF